MKLVPFSTNKWTDDTHFMVSDEDYDLVTKDGQKWSVDNGISSSQIETNANHLRIIRKATKKEKEMGTSTKIKLYRLIMGIHFKKNSKIVVDHINSWLDNTREGLRLTDSKNNSRYSNVHFKKKSNLLKGVSYTSNRKKPYRAQITVNSKYTCLGRFLTEQEAYEAYCKAAKKHFGEFAKF